ncbi:hypothetical protein UFOVP74_9 [uncultured Caudovirales phage]|uniref:Uncharacterized protein n=1 Tax=uncultured Caudovirales phage TaxID=2100421 RepID=A0A6J5KYQ4_9CAUD|nr:hypothetical protein UFOVP74_9 [uncultured Caudovirales phage]
MDINNYLSSMNDDWLRKQIATYDRVLAESQCTWMRPHWQRGRQIAIDILNKRARQQEKEQLTIF